jgi:NTP pyrophosphatase (non-canonical NTP hydrolase)
MEELIKTINKFRDDRNWRQPHLEKDLALSISLEASELLENFQWLTSEEAVAQNLDNIKEELADVMIYSLQLASDMGLDVTEIIQNKMIKNGEKYPVEG